MNKLINPNIEQLELYEPGKPLNELERELGITGAIKLASNENSIGPSPLVIKAIQESLGKLHIYPDGGSFNARRELANYLQIEENQIILGNGSDEIIAMICQCFLNPGEEVIFGDPSFLAYDLISKSFGAKCVKVPLKNFNYDLNAIASAINDNTKLIFIANPNNPTGTMVDKTSLDKFVTQLPDNVILVVDEAYYEFVSRDDFPRCLDYIQQGCRVILMRTFSKAYALAGLRIGYGIAAPELINYLNRVRHPFNVNMLAQIAAIAGLQDKDHLRRTRQMVEEGRDYLYRQFEKMNIKYIPSEANFILLEIKEGKKIFQQLLQRGVIIRAMDAYGLKDHIRVTIGTQQENQRFIESLQQVLAIPNYLSQN